MPSSLILVTGPPLPGRWALARALARRLGAACLVQDDTDADDVNQALANGGSVVVHGDLCTAEVRAALLAPCADERLLVAWMCSESEAEREIFHRWASRPRELAQRELERYVSWAARTTPVSDCESDVVVRVGARAPLSDQILRVLSAMRPRPEMVPPADERRARVLLVEDDPEQRALLGDVLRELGCAVELAPDAGVALALLESDAEPVDLVISDERMPGMSGVELAAEVARRHPEVRAVLLTAYADEGVCEQALHARARTVLRKPLSVVDLQRVLDDVQA
jgi:CheY-like chemotaxis protein